MADLPNPLAKQAAVFVYEGVHQPPAAMPVCVDALAARLGTVPEITPPKPAEIPQDNALEVFKRVKAFLGHLPKGDNKGFPEWFGNWKDEVDKVDNEARETKKRQQKLQLRRRRNLELR